MGENPNVSSHNPVSIDSRAVVLSVINTSMGGSSRYGGKGPSYINKLWMIHLYSNYLMDGG
jgi:hypothetical protein